MIRGVAASDAVDQTIAYIESLRIKGPNYLGNVIFCFPRIKMDYDDRWTDASPFLAGVAGGLHNPESNLEDVTYYGEGYTMPSVVVPLSGIRDVEYQVSRQNMFRLLRVGCIVIRPNGNGFAVRIPSQPSIANWQAFHRA